MAKLTPNSEYSWFLMEFGSKLLRNPEKPQTFMPTNEPKKAENGPKVGENDQKGKGGYGKTFNL